MPPNFKLALFSLHNLSNVTEVAEELINMGWNIIATEETVAELKKNSLPVVDISSFINFHEDFGFPPTLHPKIEAALTTDLSHKISLVYIDPYPLSKGNDVGGHTVLGLAAKGKRIVASSIEDMKIVLADLKNDSGHQNIREGTHIKLMNKAYAMIAEHYLSLLQTSGYDRYDGFICRSALKLENGENPYQVPAHLLTHKNSDMLSLDQYSLLSDNVPCFVNLADLDSIQHLLCLIAEAFDLNYGRVPYISIAAKHGNPCGMAIDWDDPLSTIRNALFGDTVSIWGGEFIVNFKINENHASLLKKDNERKKRHGSENWMLDVIAAPDFTKEALEILSTRKTRKILKNSALYKPVINRHLPHYRQVRGGFLRQPYYHYVLNLEETQQDLVLPIGQDVDSLILAWAVVWCSNHGGNEVALTKNRKLIGVGGGPSTVEAARIAVSRAHRTDHDTRDSVFAADAFFPFVDAPEILKEAGCTGGIVPGGGKNEDAVRNFFRVNNMNVSYIQPIYRGFCRH